MAWVSLSIIGITSISFVRRRKFELFYYSHALFLAFIIGALTHASHGPEFLVPGLALWAIDRLIRFVYSFQRIQVTSVEAYEGDVTKFKVRGLRTFHPGQIVWIQIPQVSFLNWHPFTVASAPGEDEHTIAIRGIGNYTKKTHGLVKSIQGVGGEDGGAVTPFKMRMDGPYGVGRTEWGVHPVTILVAGGIGITPGISIASHILKRAGQRNARIEGNNSEWHIHLLWVVRDESHVDWFREELSQLQSLASSPSVPATFDVTIHVTGRSLGAGYEGTRTKRPRVKEESLGTVIPGRPDISEWFQDISRRHDAFHAAVSACGPRTLIRSVRKAAARVSGEKVLFSVDEEVFGF
jgi:predicted ferric reductase